MKEIGEYLKNRRNELGISLNEAEQDLKIRKKYLIALEEGDESVLPGKTYFIGYLRNYSNYLQLGQDFINQHIDKPEQVAAPAEPELRIKRRKSNKYFSPKTKMKRELSLKRDKVPINLGPFFRIVVVILLIGGFVFILNQFVHRLRQPSRIIPIAEEKIAPTEKTMEQEMLEIAQERLEKEEFPEAEIEKIAMLAPLPDYEPIEIVASEPGWLKIVQNEQMLFEGIITSTENILVKTDGLISLLTSSPNKISVSYNGETLEPEPLANHRLIIYEISAISSPGRNQ